MSEIKNHSGVCKHTEKHNKNIALGLMGNQNTKGKSWKCKNGFKNRSKAKKGNQNTLGKHWKSPEGCQSGKNNGFYGKHHSRKTKKKMRQNNGGKNNPMYRRHHSKISIEKNRASILKYYFEESKEHREKRIKTRIKYFQTHKGNFKNTDIELITEKELNKCCALNTIEYYEKQFKIGRYLVDFYIPKWKLVIECNSKYWHKGFVKKIKDMRRKEALEKMGYRVLILWDKEIKAKDFGLRKYLN